MEFGRDRWPSVRKWKFIRTARINFRLSFARPPTNLPLHEIEISLGRLQSIQSSSLLAFRSTTIYSGVGTKDYHRSGSCPSLAPPSHFFSFSPFILSRFPSPGAFYSRSKCATLNFPSSSPETSVDSVHGFPRSTNASFHLLACAKRLRNSGRRRDGFYVASARKSSRIDDGK